ncbi:hypothetical protein MTO98_09955 [Mucilaginibacter sp. SMC90]|uniref:hypothetical protein n=1 Tax=Mucilaginibacter sp. SMC90 TaxID=2929803 RepID=UPI001FB4939D|nr:hypothetical protein [Mucilaginibacter sp. SMC90]UOE51399.1 hypothetical protein MTO98_09955 [Mucilaginibacter sp. SMC90]
MHIKYFFIVAVLAFCLLSCKKDNNAANPDVTIVGKWYLKKYQTRSYKNDKLMKDTSRANYTDTDFEVFNTDGSGYTSNFTTGGETALIKYNYTLNGKVLTISQNTPAFYAGTYTVIQLTENTLEVTYESAIIFNGDHYHGIDNILFKK